MPTNSDLLMRLRTLAEQKGYGWERAVKTGHVRLWDPMLQGNRPYKDGSKAWPIKEAIEFLKGEGDVS
jgi:hypothetical protein